MPLRTRLAVLFALAVLALLTAGGQLLQHQLVTGMDAALDRALITRADAVAQQLGPDGTVRDFQDGVTTRRSTPADALTQIIGPSGALTESSEGAGARPLLNPAQLDRARATAQSLTVRLAGGPTTTRLLAIPVAGTGHPPTVVVVGASRQVVDAALGGVHTALWIAGPVAVLLAGWGAWAVAGASLRPVERMRARAAAISASDTTTRLPVPARNDEIARLGTTMNALLDRLHDALARQRRFVADAGHELRTPLTSLRTELELADRPRRDRAALAAAVRAAIHDTDRLIRLAEDLLTLAGADEAGTLLRLEPLDVYRLAAEAVDAARRSRPDRRITVGPRGPTPPAVVWADRDRLRQVLDNLIDNAARHTPPDSVVTVDVSCAGEQVAVAIQDDGPGFAADFLPHAFDRFTRADDARVPGAGTGLGLAIVASLVAAQHGTVCAANRATGGAEIVVRLPRVRRTAETAVATTPM
jgi:signal transduction histidine kinase